MRARLDLVALGVKVTQLRVKAALTQAALAAKCGVSVKQVNNIERARNGPSIELYMALCLELGVGAPPLLKAA